MEIRFDDELTCRFALEVEWSTATHVSVVSQRSSECQTLLQNRQFISELRKGTKPVIRLWQEKVFICYFTSFQNFSMKSNCLTLGQKSPKSLIATAAILVVRTARGAGATSLLRGHIPWPDPIRTVLFETVDALNLVCTCTLNAIFQKIVPKSNGYVFLF